MAAPLSRQRQLRQRYCRGAAPRSRTLSFYVRAALGHARPPPSARPLVDDPRAPGNGAGPVEWSMTEGKRVLSAARRTLLARGAAAAGPVWARVLLLKRDAGADGRVDPFAKRTP